MKGIYIILAVAFVSLTSCSDFLDTQNLTQKNTANFPATENDMYAALIGAYSNQIALRQNEVVADFFSISMVLSDDQLGGGESDRAIQALNAFKKFNDEQLLPTWKNYYAGIFSCKFCD